MMMKNKDGSVWKAALWFVLGLAVGIVLMILFRPDPVEAGYRGDPPSASASVECGEITMSFVNPTPWLFVFDYRVDGEAVVSQSPWAGLQFNSSSPLYPQYFGDRWHLVPVANNNNQDIVLTFGEDTGVHQVEYRLAEGAEQDMYFDWTSRRVQSDCEEPQPTTRMCHWLGEGFEAIAVTETARARHFNAHKLDKDWEEGMDALCEFDKPEPTPTPVPEPTPRPTTPAGAPQCTATAPVLAVSNPLVWRLGATAVVQWQPQANANRANIYYYELQNPDNAHAVRDIENSGYYEINELGNLDWVFGVQESQDCAGGQITWIEDGNTAGWVLFTP